jgi:nicotinate-nucleotide pyrophosphorylase (carboxylating)
MALVVKERDASGSACRLEASGTISLNTVADIAATGVDAVSVGAVTHSAPALDISLLVIQPDGASSQYWRFHA